MNRFTAACALALTVFVWAGNAQAAILLQDDFESYANQAAFQAAWPTSGTGTTSFGTNTEFSTDQAFSPTHSIRSAPTAAGTLGGFRNDRNFGETVSTVGNEIEFSFRFFDTNATNNSFRQYVEMVNGAGTGTADIVALGLNNNIAGNVHYMARMTSVDGGAGSSAFFKLDGSGVPTRSNGWHELKALVKPTSVDFYVDGIFSKTVALPAAGQSKSYERIRLGSNLSSAGGQVYFDDVLVQTIPEPASLAVLALAGVGLFRRRRA